MMVVQSVKIQKMKTKLITETKYRKTDKPTQINKLQKRAPFCTEQIQNIIKTFGRKTVRQNKTENRPKSSLFICVTLRCKNDI